MTPPLSVPTEVPLTAALSLPLATIRVAVLGSRDTGTARVAKALNALPPNDGPHINAVADASAEPRPHCALVLINVVCVIRPDDMRLLASAAALVPTMIVLIDTDRHPQWPESARLTAARLTDAGFYSSIPAARAVLAEPEDPKPARIEFLALTMRQGLRRGDFPSLQGAATCTAAQLHQRLQNWVRCGFDPAGLRVLPPARRQSAPSPVRETTTANMLFIPPPSQTPNAPTAVPLLLCADWLSRVRSEVIAARSLAVRRDLYSARTELLHTLAGQMRQVNAQAREQIANSSRAELAMVSDFVDAACVAAVQSTLEQTHKCLTAIALRHLGPDAPQPHQVTVPTTPTLTQSAPRYPGEDGLVLVMGAAGGMGLGRLLLAPLAESPGWDLAVLPFTIIAGLTLGLSTVRVRRTQALRTHMLSLVADRVSTVRSDTERLIAAAVADTETTIADSVVHDPGPRVRQLDARIAAHRQSQRRAMPTSASASASASAQ